MFESWFTNRCMALVGSNGRRLEGEAKQQAEAVLNQAKLDGFKVWADKEGLLFKKSHGLFAKSEPLFDIKGNRMRICGRSVHIRANYCSRCASDAPGGWWRCGECGKPVGNESTVCPHCGHHMNPLIRSDISTGSWIQRDGVFAERFDLADVNVLLPYGLNIQENQRGLFLEGGELAMVMAPGHYACEDFRSEEVKQYGEHSIVFVSLSEFSLPLRVSSVRTKEAMTSDVHIALTLQFDPDNGNSFLCNLMRNRLEFNVGDLCSTTLGYDEIMEKLLQPVDDIVRRFCVTRTIEELFKSASIRADLETMIIKTLTGQLHSMGLRLIRLGELDFESEAFEKLWNQEGQIEEQRRKNEFILEADSVANDATKRKAISDQEMEDYMANLAQKGQINAELRDLEIKRIRRKWQYEELLDEMTQEQNQTLEKMAKEFKLTKEQLAGKSEIEFLELANLYNKKDEEQRLEAKLRLQKINDELKELDTRHAAELNRLLTDKQSEYDQIIIGERIKEVERRIKESDAMLEIHIAREHDKLDIERKKAKIAIYLEWKRAKQEIAKGTIALQDEKNKVDGDKLDRDADRDIKVKDAEADRQIKLKNAETDSIVRVGQGLNGVSIFAIIAATKDPSTRDKLVEAHLGEIERRMKPEVLLAAMAKRGNDEAQARIDRMDKEHKEHLEKTVEDNKQMYQAVMDMNERMFNQMTEKMSRPNGGSISTTHVIKQD